MPVLGRLGVVCIVLERISCETNKHPRYRGYNLPVLPAICPWLVAVSIDLGVLYKIVQRECQKAGSGLQMEKDI